ncbi:hypothetical protein [Muriicola soli]|uniref:Lipocalin-like domain-containing protein n=1 Tax=Muriicola soli TaxID=2507538 RepID=A0A411EAE5_9FLAO|nr:hypothetical protein [Muriicola soli]QBA64513.1 hypothetical protein EQY75_08245 [Muriicola soli]
MKKYIKILGLAIIVVIAAIAISSKPNTMHSMQGVWELKSFSNWNGNAIDTVDKAPGYRQVKIYYNGKIMWSRWVPGDEKGRFGYGSYKITDTDLIETIEYGDYEMMQALDTMRVFTFELDLKDDTYSQITLDNEGNPTFSENYVRID